jgi:hypothetical protein
MVTQLLQHPEHLVLNAAVISKVLGILKEVRRHVVVDGR